MLQIPIGRGKRDSDTVLGSKDRTHLLDQGDVVGRVALSSSAIISLRILPVDIHTVKTVRVHEGLESINELGPVIGGARHCAEGSSGGTGIGERPAAHRNPRLKTLICVLQSGESVVEITRAPVHRSDLEGRRVKEGEGEVDVGEAVEI